MWVQAGGIWLIAWTPNLTADRVSRFCLWTIASMLLGLGTALVYPTLLAAIGDVVHPGWRASAVGVYRLWRDLGYAVGALLSGIVADVFGLVWAVVAVGTLTFGSGIVVAVRMRETTATREIQVQ
jgi:MFS family permease